LLDIYASAEKRPPDIRKIKEIAGECFMPMGYGGGITGIDQIKEIFQAGVEKVVLNYSAAMNISLVTHASKLFGNQSIVASMDVKKNLWGKYSVYTLNGRKSLGVSPVEYAQKMEQAGAGEIFLNSIERDGTYSGYDVPLVRQVAESVGIPVVACGGASSVEDMAAAVRQGGASAVAAGSMFVFHGKHKAVLINFPTQEELKRKLYRVDK
ncbi:MAG: HisA/HisF-related TIM barrel protein, partial [Bacteroidota bacterium]